MKIVKSWKKNLKKTGALALATLVMCGSASFVRAENITLNQLGSDKSIITNDGFENQHAVYGYQTGDATGYAANITWGDMIFVYDNGNYNPNTGCIETTTDLVDLGVEANAKYTDQTKKIQIEDEFEVYFDSKNQGSYYLFNDNNYYSLEDDTKFDGTVEDLLRHDSPSTILLSKYSDTDQNLYYCSNLSPNTYFRADNHELYVGEIDPLTPEYEDVPIPTIGHWYGFDGINNAVKIENLSTGAVEITATPLSNGDKSGDAEFTLYTFNNSFVVTDSSDKQALEYQETTFFSNHDADADYHGPGSDLTSRYFTNKEVGLKRTFAAATFNDDGSLNKSDKDAIYLNISGKPDGGLTTNTAGEELGTITLSFKVVDGVGTVGDSLTPVVPVVEQGNQG